MLLFAYTSFSEKDFFLQNLNIFSFVFLLNIIKYITLFWNYILTIYIPFLVGAHPLVHSFNTLN